MARIVATMMSLVRIFIFLMGLRLVFKRKLNPNLHGSFHHSERSVNVVSPIVIESPEMMSPSEVE